MKTTDCSILRKFYTVVDHKNITEELYNLLLKRWNLDGIDLEVEQEKINRHASNLSKSRRDAVPEFIFLKKILEENKMRQEEENKVENSFDMQPTQSVESDQINL